MADTTDTIQLGVLDFCKYVPGAAPRYPLTSAVELARRTESWGYTRYWLGEHHASDVALCNPEILIPVIGNYTKKIRLGAAGILLRHYQPYKVAQTFRLLSALYPGRIDLGIASGRPNAEFNSHLSSCSKEELPAKVKDLCGYLYDPSLAFLSCPQGAAPPPVWLLGTHAAMQMAEQNGTALAVDCFYSKLSLEETRDMIQEYRSSFHPTGSTDAPECCLAVAGVCAESDLKAKQYIERYRNIRPWDPLTPRIVGSQSRCRDILWNLTQTLDVHSIVFLDLSIDLEERIRSYGLLAEAVELQTSTT